MLPFIFANSPHSVFGQVDFSTNRSPSTFVILDKLSTNIVSSRIAVMSSNKVVQNFLFGFSATESICQYISKFPLTLTPRIHNSCCFYWVTEKSPTFCFLDLSRAFTWIFWFFGIGFGYWRLAIKLQQIHPTWKDKYRKHMRVYISVSILWKSLCWKV